MADEVGHAYVTLLPSLRGFSKATQLKLKAALRSITDDKVELKVAPELDESKAASVGRRASVVAQRAIKPVNIPIKFDGRKLQALVGGIGRSLTSIAAVSLKTGGVGVIAGGIAAAVTGLASAIGASLPALIGLGAAAANTIGVLAVVPGAVAAAVAAVAVLKIGMVGLSDAFKAIAADDAEKLNEALKKLAPTAQALVKRVAAFRPAFKSMQLGVQNALFRDTAKVFDQLASGFLPIAVTGFTQLAATINSRALPALLAMNSAGSRSIIAGVLAAANRAAGNLLTTLIPVGKALLNVLGASTALAGELSTGLAGAITRTAERISAFATPGRLRTVFEQGSAAVKQFIGLGRDLLGILGGIFRAAGSDSSSAFGFFTRLNELVNSPAVQKSLGLLFSELARVGSALAPVLGALASALVPVAKGIALIAEAFAPALVAVLAALGPALGSLAPAIAALAPTAVSIAGALAPLAQILSGLVASAAPGLAAFLSGVAAGLVPLAAVAPAVGQALGQVFTVLGTLAASAGASLAPILGLLAQSVSQLMVALAPLLTVGLNVLSSVISALVPDVTALVKAVAPLAVMLGVELARTLTPLIPAFTKIARIIAEELVAAIPSLVQLFQQMVPVLTQLAQQFAGNLLTSIEAILPRLPELVSSAITLALTFGQLLITLLPLLPTLVGLAVKVVELLDRSGLLQTMVTLLIVALYALTGGLLFLEANIRLVVGAIQWGIEFLKRLKDGVSSTAGGIVSAIGSVPGKITAALGNMGSLLYEAGRNVVQGLIDGIKSMLSHLGSAASSVAGTIRSFLPFSPAKQGPLSGSGNPYHSGQVIASDVAAGVQSQLPMVSSAASQLAGMFGVGGPGRAAITAGAAGGFTIDAEGDRWSQMLLQLFKEVIRENGYGSNPVAALTS